MPQLVIIADRVRLAAPSDAEEGAPVMGGFQYALPDEGIDYSVNVHDVYVDKDLGSYANVSVIYAIPDEAEEPEEDEEPEEPGDNVVQFPTYDGATE